MDKIKDEHVPDFQISLFSVAGAREYDLPTSGTKFLVLWPDFLYTFEFQKRGLPHCHTLVWVDAKDKIRHAPEIDIHIPVELPDPETDPDAYRVVSEMMVHGPGGLEDSEAVCMKEEKYGKKFPKKYNHHTIFRRKRLRTYKIAAQIVRPVGEPLSVADNAPIKRDEIQNFIDGRYICPHEACWRIIKYEIHSRQPSVQILAVHLENMQPVTFRDRQPLKMIVNDEGCRLFKDIRSVHNRLYPNFRAACEALGLLGDDREWHVALQKASFSSTCHELRLLFAQMLIFCDVADPLKLWKVYWKKMSDDIPMITSKSLHVDGLYMNDPELEGAVLYELEIVLNSYSKTVADFGLPPLSKKLLQALRNKELMEEKGSNRVELAKEVVVLVLKLNSNQKDIYDGVLGAIAANRQELIFVYGHGGTGKTFLWKVLISVLRSQGKIVLAVASSGITSLLLPAGRTRCFETMDKTPRDILDVPDKLFGGKTVVLGGDFRQTLPVKKGDGKVEDVEENTSGSCSWITIPDEYCIKDDDTVGTKNRGTDYALTKYESPGRDV
nr:DNA helicase [Tanacetum cinerariifolium]